LLPDTDIFTEGNLIRGRVILFYIEVFI
jgi:hypothetical protein